MIDFLAQFFLLFSDMLFIIPILLVSLLFFNKQMVYHAICLLFLSIMVNVALKVSFQVPLSPALHKEGFAFPSGHMQLTTVFYGWLAAQTTLRPLRGITLFLMCGIGLSLVHFGYHTLIDVIAGVLFGLLLLFFYQRIYQFHQRFVPWIWLVFTTFLLAYIQWRTQQIAAYVWQAYFALWVTVGLQKIVQRRQIFKESCRGSDYD